MSCEHFAIFFPNLPFMSYIRQNYSISKKQQKTAFLKKVLSIKLPDSHFRVNWGFPMQRRLMGKKLRFLHYSSLLLWVKPQVSNLWYKIPVWQNNYIHTMKIYGPYLQIKWLFRTVFATHFSQTLLHTVYVSVKCAIYCPKCVLVRSPFA